MAKEVRDQTHRGLAPKSVNLLWPDLVDPETNTFTPLDEAEARLEALGAQSAGRVVCYCGGGISAPTGLFFLHRLGYDDLAL